MARRKKGQQDQAALFQDALFDAPATSGDAEPDPAEALHQDQPGQNQTPADRPDDDAGEEDSAVDDVPEDEGLAHVDQAEPAAPATEPTGDPEDGERVVEVTETVVSRTCGWCGKEMDQRGRRGRPRKYCGNKHRNLAYEVRRAEERLGRQLAIGTLAADPVREVVNRVIRIEVPVVRIVEVPARHPTPPTWPADPMPSNGPSAGPPTTAHGWADQLAALEEQIRSGSLRHYDHRRVYTALSRVAAAVDAAHPGGLDALLRGR